MTKRLCRTTEQNIGRAIVKTIIKGVPGALSTLEMGHSKTIMAGISENYLVHFLTFQGNVDHAVLQCNDIITLENICKLGQLQVAIPHKLFVTAELFWVT